ncbi:MAG: right-handed parallel beta-helix repeat-containing protein [Candidatus Thorarchaeota archaeon]
MKKSTYSVLGITIFILMVSAPLLSSINTVGVNPTTEVTPINKITISYTEHAPIQIDNNTHFADVAAAESWDGDGSSDTPYIISGYNITKSGIHGIYINDTTFHFEIRDCYIDGINKAGSYYGIFLENCVNSTINNCTAIRNQYGIQVEWSSSIIINNCTVIDSGGQGIGTHFSDDCQITGCNVITTGARGVYVSASDNAVIDDVFVEDTDYEGVYIQGSDDVTLNNSEIINCGGSEEGSAIRVLYSDDVTLENVLSHNNTGPLVSGIYCYDSNRLSISQSDFYYNEYHGINIVDSNDATIVDVNCFFNYFFGIRTYNSNGTTISGSEIHENYYDGLYMQSSYLGYVEDCEFWENGGGDCEITLDNSPNVTIFENTLLDNRDGQGLTLTYSHFANITGNTISGNPDEGINAQNSNFVHIEGNNISDNGNYGIWLDNVNNSEIVDNTLSRNDAIGILISSCQNLTISENEVFGNRGEGVVGQWSPGTIIDSNIIFDNGWIDLNNPQSGIYLYDSDDCEVTNNIVFNNTIHGIHFYLAENSTIALNTIYGNRGMTGVGCGIRLDNAHGTNITDNVIYENTDHGIRGVDSDDCDIIGNTIYNDTSCGISVHNCHGWEVDDNLIANHSSVGVNLFQSSNFSFVGNELFENTMGGVVSSQTHNCTFTNNYVHDNSVSGIQIDTSTNWIVSENIFISNNYGVYLIYAGGCHIYYNDFGWNTHADMERDSVSTNLWDDNVSLGNYYFGYDPTSGPYPVTNDSFDVVNYDRYPMASFWIEPELEGVYEFATTGNDIILTAYALNPSYYEVYANDSVSTTAAWDGSDIVISFDTFNVGYYEIKVRAYHMSGEYVEAIGNVTIEDTTAPTWVETPVDQSVFWGFAFSYQIGAFDASDLGTWSVNDTRFSITDGLLTNTTTLETGTYHIRISVSDIYGNTLFIDITITQLAQPIETTPPPTDTTDTTPTDDGLTTVMLIVGIAGAGVVVVLVILNFKKKS